MDELANFLQIGIVSSIVSVVVQIIKYRWGADSDYTRVVVVLLSILCAGLFWWLKDTSFWPQLIGILTFATTFHAYFLKNDK